MNQALRSSDNLTEIIAMLKQLQDEGIACVIWQSLGDKKIHTKCVIKSIDRRLGTVVLAPEEGAFPLDFEKRYNLYFRGEKLSLLFKEMVHFTSEQLVVINIPREIRVLEKRKIPRINFQFGEGKSALASKYDKASLEARYFELELLDLSVSGLAFFMTTQQAGSIVCGDQLFFSNILSCNLGHPLIATVLYCSPTKIQLKDVSKKGYRIGVVFDERIPQEQWKELPL